LRYLRVVNEVGDKTSSLGDADKIENLFPNTFGQPFLTVQRGKQTRGHKNPLRIGVVLSGGQAAGGHNVICGLFDFVKSVHPDSQLIGFLAGPIGIIKGKSINLTESLIDQYRNQGGFDIIGTGRDKIEKKEHFEASRQSCIALDLDGLVVIGGDDSNTNAALLAEDFSVNRLKTKIIGVPKTIDGDLKDIPNKIETSFGFDTATKMYSHLIANIATDSNSARKYYHFIRLMGRSASHITLECALKTHPNIALIGEEVEAKKQTLSRITDDMCTVIARRAEKGKNFGIILLPEGLIEFVPEVNVLIKEINEILANNSASPKQQQQQGVTSMEHLIRGQLTEHSGQLFDTLPASIREELLLERDPHGNVQVSKIETEKLLIKLITDRLAVWKKEGKFKGSFAALSHFFGYEGRCCLPSNFDSNYCYALGNVAGALVEAGKTGYMASVGNLSAGVGDWKCGGVPLTVMMNVERRAGKDKPVIRKALVDLEGRPFGYFVKRREKWSLKEDYVNPGPIQFYGPNAEDKTLTLILESGTTRPFKSYL